MKPALQLLTQAAARIPLEAGKVVQVSGCEAVCGGDPGNVQCRWCSAAPAVQLLGHAQSRRCPQWLLTGHLCSTSPMHLPMCVVPVPWVLLADHHCITCPTRLPLQAQVLRTLVMDAPWL